MLNYWFRRAAPYQLAAFCTLLITSLAFAQNPSTTASMSMDHTAIGHSGHHAAMGHTMATAGGHKAGENATIKTSVRAEAPLEVGKKSPMIITLKDAFGEPVTFDDLVEMHTEKIHLLIVDPSLGDYHHIHPKPTQNPGEYAFEFQPRKSGKYLAYADLVPVKTNDQEYSVSSIEVPGTPEPVVKQQDRKVKVGDYTFELSFENPELVQGENNRATLKVFGPDGEPFTDLEPVMGAFAHMVAFSEDRQHVAHVHPQGKEPEGPNERGGPELTFYINITEPGYHLLYSQVQIDGEQVFAPYGLQVAPREIPNTVGGIFQEVDTNMARLENVISNGKLAQVHGLAFWIRDVLLGLKNAEDLPAEAKEPLGASLKRIESYADLLDRFGDANEADKAASVFQKFKEETGKIRELVNAPAASTDTVDATPLGNQNCPVSKMPVGSMEPGAALVYNGQKIGLCCSGCKETFMSDPEAYLQKAKESVKK